MEVSLRIGDGLAVIPSLGKWSFAIDSLDERFLNRLFCEPLLLERLFLAHQFRGFEAVAVLVLTLHILLPS